MQAKTLSIGRIPAGCVTATTDPITGGLTFPGAAGLNATAVASSLAQEAKTPFVQSATKLATGILGQFSDGSYLAFDTFPGIYEGSARLRKITGDPLGANTFTPLSETSVLATNALKNTLGTVIGNVANSILTAWIASNGDVFFVAVSAGNYHHLFRAKAGTYTVGSDSAYSNKQACVDLGLYGGVHADQVRILSQRSFLEAKVGNAKHLFMCEYNVSGGRTAGAGGAGKDQAIAYRSTDGGTTWAVFFEFNTGGSHVVDHFHGAVQDPYTGWIYFMTGDTGAECALIGYNGTAATVAANASLATIGSSAGYKVINGSELNRYTDLAFSATHILSIPDCDTESADTSSTAFVSTLIPKMLEYVSVCGTADRFADIPPLLVVNTPSGRVIVSFRTQSAKTTDEPYIWVWGERREGQQWSLIAKLKTYRSATGTPRSAFCDASGRVWIGATQKGAVAFVEADAASSATSSSYCLVLSQSGEVVVAA